MPGAETAGLESEHSESNAGRDRPSCSLHSAEERHLLFPVGNPRAVQTCPTHPDEDEQETKDRDQDLVPVLQAKHSGAELVSIQVQGVGSHHLPRSPAQPALRRREGDADALRQPEVASAADELSQSMVIGLPVRRNRARMAHFPGLSNPVSLAES